MIQRKKIIFISLVIIILSVVIARGVFMKSNYALYSGEAFRFEYPKGWTMRESRGSSEKYFQVHVFGAVDKDVKFGPSITVTVYPKKESGSKFSSLSQLMQDYLLNAGKMRGYRLESDDTIKLKAGIMARDIKMVYILRLPLYNTKARDVLLGERTIFFESGLDLFVLSYKNVSADYPSFEAAIARAIQTFRFNN